MFIGAATLYLEARDFGVGETMRMIVSLSVLGASLFVILAKRYSTADKHWAYGAIGTVVGFWLHIPK
jgi:hypothetical protein